MGSSERTSSFKNDMFESISNDADDDGAESSDTYGGYDGDNGESNDENDGEHSSSENGDNDGSCSEVIKEREEFTKGLSPLDLPCDLTRAHTDSADNIESKESSSSEYDELSDYATDDDYVNVADHSVCDTRGNEYTTADIEQHHFPTSLGIIDIEPAAHRAGRETRMKVGWPGRSRKRKADVFVAASAAAINYNAIRDLMASAVDGDKEYAADATHDELKTWYERAQAMARKRSRTTAHSVENVPATAEHRTKAAVTVGNPSRSSVSARKNVRSCAQYPPF